MKTPARIAVLALLLAACRSEDAPIQEPTPITDLSTVFRYPESAWDAGREGRTVLMVHVTAAGDVDSSYVAESSGDAGLDSVASSGVRRARFAPARRGDERIDRWIRLPVDFSRDHEGLGMKPKEKP